MVQWLNIRDDWPVYSEFALVWKRMRDKSAIKTGALVEVPAHLVVNVFVLGISRHTWRVSVIFA